MLWPWGFLYPQPQGTLRAPPSDQAGKVHQGVVRGPKQGPHHRFPWIFHVHCASSRGRARDSCVQSGWAAEAGTGDMTAEDAGTEQPRCSHALNTDSPFLLPSQCPPQSPLRGITLSAGLPRSLYSGIQEREPTGVMRWRSGDRMCKGSLFWRAAPGACGRLHGALLCNTVIFFFFLTNASQKEQFEDMLPFFP